GDVLVAINGKKMKNPSEVQAAVNSYKPGDKIELLVCRDGKESVYEAVLQGEAVAVAATDSNEATVMGATLAEADKQILVKLRLRGGVQVVDLGKGKFKDAGVRKGLIITHINQTPVATLKEALEIINNARRGMLIEGVYSNGDVYYYGVGV
ncbi:MAG: PDZ domain-containing protein, partial [Bacteroidales bacterium]|nr:PDZ domain-containing protein [Bacteroidales bacterium]